MLGRGLTRKQKEVLDYIRNYIEANSHAPYLREIQEGCNFASYRSVFDKLISLEKKGYISRKLNKHRSISLEE